MTSEQFDKDWELSLMMLATTSAVIKALCACKPSSKAPDAEKAQWEARIAPFRAQAIEIGNYRYNLLIQRNKGLK